MPPLATCHVCPNMAAAAWFALLCAASVTMTLGNKLLMVGALNQHKDLLVLLQNAIGALTLAALAWYHSLDVGLPLDRRLTLLFITDALVRYVQLYTSFAALQHLPVAATTVVRALAVPAVAWFEWLLLGSRLTLWQWAFSSVVVAGAGLYAHADLAYSRPLLLGYAWRVRISSHMSPTRYLTVRSCQRKASPLPAWLCSHKQSRCRYASHMARYCMTSRPPPPLAFSRRSTPATPLRCCSPARVRPSSVGAMLNATRWRVRRR